MASIVKQSLLLFNIRIIVRIGDKFSIPALHVSIRKVHPVFVIVQKSNTVVDSMTLIF